MKMVALIIDDDSLNTEVLVHLLKREGVKALSLKYPDQLPEFVKSVRDVEVISLTLNSPTPTASTSSKSCATHPIYRIFQLSPTRCILAR
jgi:CheY-like chemotaxis protein